MSLLSKCKDTIIEITSIATFAREPPKEPPLSDDSNPITAYFDVREKYTSAGPGLIWAVHNAYKKSDGKPASVFYFDKRDGDRLFKPKRKDDIYIKMRDAVARLSTGDYKATLIVIHKLEEGPNTMAFATEPVLTSLHHIFAWYESMFDREPVLPFPPSLHYKEGGKKKKYKKPKLPPYATEYFFMEVELRYGLLQIIDALHCLHYDMNVVHTNVCPQNVIITKRGIWKLFGLEFLKPITTEDPSALMNQDAFNPKFTSASQPNLDYSAPEVQATSQINVLSDMFSFGMIIFAFYNNGKSLFDANENPMLYLKQLETLNDRVMRMLPKMPLTLQEAAERMLNRDPEPRPPTALLPLTKYFSSTATTDPVIRALQGFADLKSMDRTAKIEFLKSITSATIDQLPRKLRFLFVFDAIKQDLRTADGLAHCLPMVVYIIKDEPDEIYSDLVYPAIKNMYTRPFMAKNPLAVISYLDAMHVFLSKCERNQPLREEITPVLLWAMENNDKGVLASAVECLMRCMEWFDDELILNQALPKIRPVLERHYNDLKMSLTVLSLFETLMHKLDRTHLVNYVIPSMLIMKLNDASVMERFVSLYKRMVTDERLGIPHEVMATKMLPSVAPHIVNKNMDQSQLTGIMEMLQHMLKFIERNQRIAIEEYKNRPPSPPKNLASRQISMDEPAPAFCIPQLKRKVSSAEEMARKNSEAAAAAAVPNVSTTSVTGNIRRISQWFFGSNNSTNSNNMNMGGSAAGSVAAAASGNFLRVANLLPGRRLSDNTLMAPKIKIAPSCASSPGGTPGGSQAGLPTRRHSSIGPQERRPSHANLSPPTAQYGRGRGAGSGSSLSVPAHSHPAGGSLPGSSTTYLDPNKGSAASVQSAQSALAARAALGPRGAPRALRRPSGCPPSASSGAAAASLQGADFAQCGPTATAARDPYPGVFLVEDQQKRLQDLFYAVATPESSEDPFADDGEYGLRAIWYAYRRTVV